MQTSEFVSQLERLKARFGDRAFDTESCKLILNEVRNMTLEEFTFLVDGMIASRKHTFAPLVIDFREARLTLEKRIGDMRDRQAKNQFDKPSQGALKAYLEKEFPGCKTLNEAIKVRQLQIRLQKIEDPNYDPMADPKWK